MTQDDKILTSLIGDPNELISVQKQSATLTPTTTVRTKPMHKAGKVFAVKPSPKALEPALNQGAYNQSGNFER